MSLEKKIRSAYDSVHAPEALTEQLKQELYQQDLRAEDIVGGIVEEAPRRNPLRMLLRGSAFVAASVLVFIGIGIGVRQMRNRAEEFRPGTAVSAPAAAAVPDVSGMTVEAAGRALRDAGFKSQASYSDAAQSAVTRTEPPAGTQLPAGSTVRIICE